jgi:hypothetical protein
MLFLLLLCLLAFAATCSPPFNDFKYLPNDTYTTAQIIHGINTSPVGSSWTEVVTFVSLSKQIMTSYSSLPILVWIPAHSLAKWLHPVLLR